MRDTRHQPAEGCQFFRLDQGGLGLPQIPQRRLGGIAGAADLAFAPLALGDLFGGDIDADNVAIRTALRMPIGDPAALVIMARALTVDLNASHGITGLHDRAHNGLNRRGKSGYAFPHGMPEMSLDRDAAYLGRRWLICRYRQSGERNARPMGAVS